MAVMAEGNETPGGESGRPPTSSERDLLAERRARRAVDGGEAALIRRAEAAEATVHTLERHVYSLQQRLREAEEEQSRLASALEQQRGSAQAGEEELQRATQREYAEQQLRLEADERLEGMERQLSEAEQTLAGERAALARAEAELGARLGELERRAEQIAQELAAERAARERTEDELVSVRRGHAQMEALLVETKGLLSRLLASLAASGGDQAGAGDPTGMTQALAAAGEVRLPPAAQTPSTPPPLATEQLGAPTEPLGAPTDPLGAAEGAHAEEMAAALAAAVERLRARAESETPTTPPPGPEMVPAARPVSSGTESGQPPAGLQGAPPANVPDVPVPGRGPSPPDAAGIAPAGAQREPHKHSLSLIGRWRKRRKQRHSGGGSGRSGA